MRYHILHDFGLLIFRFANYHIIVLCFRAGNIRKTSLVIMFRLLMHLLRDDSGAGCLLFCLNSIDFLVAHNFCEFPSLTNKNRIKTLIRLFMAHNLLENNVAIKRHFPFARGSFSKFNHAQLYLSACLS